MSKSKIASNDKNENRRLIQISKRLKIVRKGEKLKNSEKSKRKKKKKVISNIKK